MKKTMLRPLILLLVSAACHGLAWWAKARGFWPAADVLVVGSGILLGWRVLVVGARLRASSRPQPMN